MTSRNFFTSSAVRSRAAALVVGLALALSGCNSGDSPGTGGTSSPVAAETPTASTTPTSTPTPSAVYKPADASGPAQNVPVPVLPEVAKTETKEGAEAFVRFWYETLSYAYETGKPQNLEKISGPGCVFCKGLRDGINEAWSEGRWILGGKIETPAITATVETGAESYAVVQVIQSTIEIRKPDGTLLQNPTPATNTGSRAGLTFGSSGWVMSDLGLIR
ncbi:DUF6318 family protein [Arthrobacter sp. B1I2]|uniref:DUF6318 family protein n=1 Tax=Arthrobacter sp. B1I2 TaxID=3042263 RepID=UPI0027896CF9|nr:DUF6318 family protein [Arthrobacter sp. B1I2]MDQ0729281.1 hypothetical protein [Arthrobacter sp. B1I2]